MRPSDWVNHALSPESAPAAIRRAGLLGQSSYCAKSAKPCVAAVKLGAEREGQQQKRWQKSRCAAHELLGDDDAQPSQADAQQNHHAAGNPRPSAEKLEQNKVNRLGPRRSKIEEVAVQHLSFQHSCRVEQVNRLVVP